MKRLRNFRYLTVTLISLSIGVLLFGCGSPPLIQPEGVTPTDQPKTTTASAALENEAENVSQSPLPTPTLSGATNMPAPTTSPTLDPPSPTSTTPDMLTTKTISGFQITEAGVKTDASGEAQFVLPITLNQDKLQPRVQALVYLTTTTLDDQTAESTVWSLDVEDIERPGVVITMSHLESSEPKNPVLSPNGQYLVYGLGYDDWTHAMPVALLTINEKTQQIIASGAAPRANTQAFTWAPDNQSIIYVKEVTNPEASEIHRYFLESGATELVLSEQGVISIVGWRGETIYYLPFEFTGGPYILKSFDLKTDQIQEIAKIEGPHFINSIEISPAGTHVLFQGGLLVNLQTKTQLQLPLSSQVIWFPDGGGLLTGNPLSVAQNSTLLQSIDRSQTIKFPLNVDIKQLVSWSPDGQYLVYATQTSNNQSTYYLLDRRSGQATPFATTRYFRMGGWMTESCEPS